MSTMYYVIFYAAEIVIACFLILNFLNLAIMIVVQSNYVLTMMRTKSRSQSLRYEQHQTFPFVSVQVPSYDEPSALLIETVKSLARLNYPNFEVIILDNNTPSRSTWEPVAAACRELGPRFRFYHFDGVEGAKAGALNISLDLCDPQTRYVAVVDADYRVTPDFLSRAVSALATTQAAFVQFPQAYRNVSGRASFIADELSDYFHSFAPDANSDSSMLPTGTLSVIDIERLRAVGGWSGTTVTEDADLGVRLVEKNFFGIYDPAIVGRGILPLSFDSLKIQRRRWTIGNLQTLLAMVGRGTIKPGSIGFSTIVAQLMAWPAFWLVPVISLAALAFVDTDAGGVQTIRWLAAGSIILTVISTLARLSLDHRGGRKSPLQIALIFLVKLSLIWVSSTAFFPVLWRKAIVFARTPKARTPKHGASKGTGFLRTIFGNGALILGLVGLAATILYAAHGHWPEALACTFIASTAPCSLWVDASLKRYAAGLSTRARKGS